MKKDKKKKKKKLEGEKQEAIEEGGEGENEAVCAEAEDDCSKIPF